MSDKVKNLICTIANPATGMTLGAEERISEVKVEGKKISIKYDREGISPAQKRVIEDSIYGLLKADFEEDDITIMTFSKDSKDVFGGAPAAKKESAPKQEAAQVKAGHGPVGATKKRIPNVKNVLAVSSCKGGVGKSTVSVNLAMSLKNKGYKVGILDADIYGPSMPMLLGKREAKPAANEQKKILPVEALGVHFISFGLFIQEDDAVIWRGPMLGGVLNQFLFDVEWGELDYLIIDLPPGTGDMQLSMVQATEVDAAVVVSTPQEVALLDTRKGMKMFEKVNVPILGMIENMSYFVPDDNLDKKYFIFGEGGVKNACSELKTDFLGEIPMEIALRVGSDTGVPYMSSSAHEGRPVWNAYMELANKVDQKMNGKEKKGFFSKILGK
ncbi:putative ATP-binding Mrp family protein [Halobacteriovorax marinus SJ]|uniref:Iron-sulfur cluster carrier protein n=1 Tax=Halobacteriovorax marinus (strain ATCC BAA-682 / DSM 15412 / SJ) TaxID=862908 RepID=E1X175_HALMS|nr:Mrp/NBP35 family ATP-binding protein [Halobacteriovorax marinus]CBW28145.1 putative ATP-binding Mrp family protein [Halobacteriovorax marinus SJ]